MHGTRAERRDATEEDLERYQTVYASAERVGSVAAPTAGGALWNATLFLPGAWHPRVCFGCVGLPALGLVWLGVLLPRSLERAKRPG